jgi:MazG family protein
MNDIIDHVTKKMIFRHPHVFEDARADSADDVKDTIWEAQKAKEKKAQSLASDHYLDHITRALPSLLLANKIQKKVRKIGFQYSATDDVFTKIDEEISEMKQAIQTLNKDNIEEEFGDVLFITSLLGAHLDCNPEESLRKACLKFIGRFNAVEDDIRSQDKTLDNTSIDDMAASWARIKSQ